MDHTFSKRYEIRLFRNLFIGEIFEVTQTEHVYHGWNDAGGKEERAFGPRLSLAGEKFPSDWISCLNEALLFRMGEGLYSDNVVVTESTGFQPYISFGN